MYDIKNFYQAHSIEDALKVLEKDENAVLIAGGTDVLIKMRKNEYSDCSLVSIHGIKELEGIEKKSDGTIVIKPGSCFTDITDNEIIKNNIPALGIAVDQVGSPQIRNTATIGGNICNGAVSADSAPMLLALDAILILTDKKGNTAVPLREFYTGPGKTIRKHEQLLTAIEIKKENYKGFGAHYIKFGQRNAMEISTLGCAANVKLNMDKTKIEELHLAFGVAAPTPIRCVNIEKAVKGLPTTNATFEQIGKGALQETNPRDSWRASKQLRRQLIYELSKRAVAQAIIHAGGQIYD